MSTIRRIAKNTGLMLISQIITYGLAFIYLIYSARYLGVENFGILSFAIAFAGIMVIFTDLGLSLLMTREVARDKSLASKYLKNIGTLKIILAFLTFISAIIAIFILGYTEKVIEVVALIILYTILNSFAVMFYSLFQAYENMTYQSFGYVLHSIILLVGALILIYYKFDILGFALVYFIVGIAVFMYGFFICRWKFTLPKIEVDLNFWKILVTKAVPISLIFIFSTITFRIDTVLLSILAGNVAVGFYSAPYRLMEVLIFIPAVYTASIYPVISRFHISSKYSLKIAYERSFKYLSILAIPIAVGTTLLADKIILIIYGVSFTESVIALKILIWSIPAIFLTYMFGTLMISMNKQNIGVKIIFTCMIINIVLNLIFIPLFSYIAASIITVITELTGLMMTFYFLSKYIGEIEILNVIIKPVIASLIMGMFIIYVNTNFFLLVLSSSFVYFFAFILLKGFSKEDFDLFRHILKLNK